MLRMKDVTLVDAVRLQTHVKGTCRYWACHTVHKWSRRWPFLQQPTGVHLGEAAAELWLLPGEGNTKASVGCLTASVAKECAGLWLLLDQWRHKPQPLCSREDISPTAKEQTCIAAATP